VPTRVKRHRHRPTVSGSAPRSLQETKPELSPRSRPVISGLPSGDHQMLAAFEKLSGRFRVPANRPEVVIVAAVSRGSRLSTGTSRCAHVNETDVVIAVVGSRRERR